MSSQLVHDILTEPDWIETSEHGDATILTTRIEHTLSTSRVIVDLDDGTSGCAFTYYADELTFIAPQFIGMTLSEARQAFYQADVAYLQS